MGVAMTVLRIIGPAFGDDPSTLDGMWLKEYDPDGRDGRGAVKATRNREEAMQFADAGEAMACWRRQSKVRPLRPDGKPNRPLTAFSVEIEP